MNVATKLILLRQQLKSLAQPRLEANMLMSHVLRVSVSDLLLKENHLLDEKTEKWLNQAVRRRLIGEPMAYILETRGFYKHDFVVRKGVLIPRPETELVIETALRLVSSEKAIQFADLGCGSGCIGLSLLKEWPLANLLSIDVSELAIQITNENCEHLALKARCKTQLANIEKLDFTERFDLIVANPPYISEDDPRVEENVRKFEPQEALFAPQNGLAALFSWSAWAQKALKPDGWWVTEIGSGQDETLKSKLIELGFINLGVKKDLAGHPRVVCAQKK